MRILKFIFFSTIMLLFGKAFSQQDAHYTQFMFNKLIINPSVAGSEDGIDARLLYRRQWIGMPGSPTSYNFSASMPISKDNHLGAGLSLQNDQIGFEEHLSIIGAATYHLRFIEGREKPKQLFFGLQFGARQYRIKVDELNPYNENDEVLPEVAQSRILPEIGMGFMFKTEVYYAGVSVPHLIQSRIKYTDYQLLNARQVRHYYFMAGYNSYINENLRLKPNILAKAVLNAPLELDFNCLLEYQEKAWGGLSYRTGDAIAILIGSNIGKLAPSFDKPLKIGYSYDFTVNRIPRYNSGTHEVFISYLFPIKKKALLPKFTR